MQRGMGLKLRLCGRRILTMIGEETPLREVELNVKEMTGRALVKRTHVVKKIGRRFNVIFGYDLLNKVNRGLTGGIRRWGLELGERRYLTSSTE